MTDAQRELRNHLRDAAEREMAAERPARARRRRRTRGLVVLLAGLGIAGGAATAADLIATGDPDAGPMPGSRYRPATDPAIDVVAPDRPLQWAVKAYATKDGTRCALAGQLQSGTLGRVRGDVFRPYTPDRAGACLSPYNRQPWFVDALIDPDRTILYGRARRRLTTMTLTQPGQPDAVARVGRRGTFVFVLRGRLDFATIELRGTTPAGRAITQ